MNEYQSALQDILTSGEHRISRTGIDTLAKFGMKMSFENLNSQFPATTTKKLAWKSVVGELLWFIEGSGNNERLAEITYNDPSHKTIWSANETADYWVPKQQYKGDLGRVYGVQWRSWQKPDGTIVDQLNDLINGLRDNPQDRRHILMAWNPGELDQMALPPCHMFSQFFVTNSGTLNCQMYQRSADMFLGVPFNIASYSLLTCMLAKELNLEPGTFTWVGGDCHIYANHIDQVKLLLERKPLPSPILEMNNKDFWNSTVDDFVLVDYNHHGTISAEMAV